ncbi:MAG: hypothetical protein ABIR68_15410 [Ilumatobacteraceae bacterium]
MRASGPPGLRAIGDGSLPIEQVPDVDLAAVTIPGRWRPAGAHRFAHAFTTDWTEAAHPMAVHNATAMLRILWVLGRRDHLELRSES